VEVIRAGGSALDAVVEAVRLLEDDERFNAGHGSNIRLDGGAVHMDAALIDSAGRLASVIGLADVRNPILVARDLLAAPNRVLTAPGATRYARRMGHAPFDPRTQRARERLAQVQRRLASGDPTLPATAAELTRSWNYPFPRSDTVGAVAFDGETFAAAGSTGGLIAVLDGRVSDIALFGCGLDANEHGAVAVTGAGDEIIRARVAARTLRLLEDGASAEDAAQRALAWLPPDLPLALVVLGRDGGAARGRRPFPWARA
jgi:isoaspartyl peptidase/L-asparaginase-like protein (Ntn-hydrolase superfamily)